MALTAILKLHRITVPAVKSKDDERLFKWRQLCACLRPLFLAS